MISNVHVWEMSPLWYLSWVLCDHSVICLLVGVIRDKVLAHLNLRVAQPSVRDACIAKPIHGDKKLVTACE